MKQTLDMRGQACPIPVVQAKKALVGFPEGGSVEVWVDNEIAVQNLSKMATQKQWQASYEKRSDDHFVVTIVKGEGQEIQPEEETLCVPDKRDGSTVVVLSSNKMGEGDEALGKALMKGFIYALTEQDVLPSTILLYNGGAKLSVQGSDSLEDLKMMEAQGVEILTCGTCLNHYGLTEQLAVGSVTNMYSIVEKLTQAGKVIKP